MKLNESSFERIKSGKKRIEIRLFDEKRQNPNLSDTIYFSKLPHLNEQLSVEVIGLLRYRTFKNLGEDFPISCFGYPDDHDKRAFVESMHPIYSKEDEQKYGVLGIKIV